MKYISEYRDRDEIAPRINLVRHAERAKGLTGKGKALLLCDYAAVVRGLEDIILEKRQPRFCGYYGCDTRLLGQQFELLIKSLRSINIEPVFFGDGPTGDVGCTAKFEEKKARQIQKLERSKEWEQAVKPGAKGRPKFNLPHPLCYPVCDYVLKELKVQCLISNCEADIVLIDYCKRRRNVLGILSKDTDFAIADGCRFLPLDFFDFEDVIGFQKGDIRIPKAGIKSLPCRYTSCDILAKCLGLGPHDDMPLFAMLCGNDYTRPHVCAIRKKCGISYPGNAQQVAQWIRHGKVQQKKRAEEQFSKAGQFSKDLYSGKLQYTPTDNNITSLSPIFLYISKGIFWQQPVAEAPSKDLPLAYAVSQPLRSTVYALFGRRDVTEYCHRSYKSDGSFQVCGHKNLSRVGEFLPRKGVIVSAVALHHFVNTPLHSLGLDQKRYEELQQSVPADLLPNEQDVLRGIITVSTLAYLWSITKMGMDDNEVQACLLAFAATTAGVPGNVDVGQPDEDPFLRAVSLSSIFSATLLSLYYIARLLHLAPKLSDIFCSSVFVPVYMAVMKHPPAARIPALAPVVSAADSPHTKELMECIERMRLIQDKPELTPRITLATAVRSYTALVKALARQEQQ